MPNEHLREVSPELLRTAATARAVMVDRKANVLRGFVVAQLGPFKSAGRGQFDQTALDMIVELAAKSKQGLKSRFSHPTECDDGLGKYLGRARDLYISDAMNADGQMVPAVRGDLHFDPTALEPMPGGGKPLGLYVMDLAESDPDALSSSLVLRAKKELQLNPDGTRKKDERGDDLPPLWRPTKLWASDVVDTGDAVDGLLSAGGSADGLPNEYLWQGAEILDEHLDGLDRDEAERRIHAFAEKWLTLRHGPKPAPAQPAPPSLSMLLLRQRQREVECRA